jgi:hypothetical protein
MVLRWSTFKIMSCDPNLHPRWQPSANIVLTKDPMGKLFKSLLFWASSYVSWCGGCGWDTGFRGTPYKFVNIIIVDGFLHGNIWSKRFGRKSIFTSEVYTVLKGSTSCILFRSCCNILHPSIKYVIH